MFAHVYSYVTSYAYHATTATLSTIWSTQIPETLKEVSQVVPVGKYLVRVRVRVRIRVKVRVRVGVRVREG
jgi:hypothetical protein